MTIACTGTEHYTIGYDTKLSLSDEAQAVGRTQ